MGTLKMISHKKYIIIIKRFNQNLLLIIEFFFFEKLLSSPGQPLKVVPGLMLHPVCLQRVKIFYYKITSDSLFYQSICKPSEVKEAHLKFLSYQILCPEVWQI